MSDENKKKALAAKVDPRAEAVALLTDRERSFLESYDRGILPHISPEAADKLYILFLRGLSTDDVRAVTDFTVGQIVDARIRYLWDRRRAEYDLHLQAAGADAIKRAQMEAAKLAADAIAATYKMHGQKIQKYLFSGDEKDLEGTQLGSWRTLREMLEILIRSTGQDRPRGRQESKDEPPPSAEPKGDPVLVNVGATPTRIPTSLADLIAAKKSSREE